MTDERVADAATIAAIREGDRERYRELVERYKNQVFAVAWCRLGDRSLAEDAAQEAFIKGFQRLDLLPRARSSVRGSSPLRGMHPPTLACTIGTSSKTVAAGCSSGKRKRSRPATSPKVRPRPRPSGRHSPSSPRSTANAWCSTISKARAARRLRASWDSPSRPSRPACTAPAAAMRSLLETRLEASMEQLRPSDRLPGSVMFAIATQKPAWPLLGAIGRWWSRSCRSRSSSPASSWGWSSRFGFRGGWDVPNEPISATPKASGWPTSGGTGGG